MQITITKKQLLAAGASKNCAAYKKFIADFGDKVEIEWTLGKQLEMLRDPVWRGVLGWCWWKGILPEWSMAKIDLRGADLNGINLRRANLNGTDLSGGKLNEANLSGINLTTADLTEANLNGANMFRANLTEANLSAVIADKFTIWPAGFDPHND